MKRFVTILSVLVAAVTLSAQEKTEAQEKNEIAFAYDVDFNTLFDNREFAKSKYTPSMTIFGARLTPQVGVAVNEKNGAQHRLMVGIDVMKDFGSGKNNNLFQELSMFYNLRKKISKTDMEIYAGIFPRTTMEGAWSQAFFSDSLAFYDNNLEGLLLKFRRPKAYYEVGCDWMGQFGQTRREKFMIFASGEGQVHPLISVGGSVYMLHYANSMQAKGLVDNILANPYVRFDLTQMTNLQRLSLRLGWLQAMQRDRKYVGDFVFPGGAEFDQEVRNWNFGVHNKMFYGVDMMPYYSTVDNAGIKYGNNVYFGDPFYRIHEDGSSAPGFYDRLEVYYEPQIGDFIKLKVSALFHFNSTRYCGCQQMVGIRFNLHELLAKRNK